MSLDWHIDKIENYKEVCWLPTGDHHEDGEPVVRLNPVTEALIYNTISIDIGVITYDNAGEVYARTKILEAVNGCMLTKDGKESPMTIEDIRAHIGLWCNVSFKPRKEWAQRWFVGHGDYLVKHGMKRKSVEEIEDAEDEMDSFDVSLTEELARQYRRAVSKASVA